MDFGEISLYLFAIAGVLVVAFLFMRFRSRVPGQGVRYYIVRKVKGHNQVIYTGIVPKNAQHFKNHGHAYHIDLDRVQEDKSGNQALYYELNYFEPLEEASKEVKDPDLALHPSQDAHTVLNTGLVTKIMGAVSGPQSFSMMTIVMLVLAGGLGYLVGSQLPMCSFMGGCGVQAQPVYVTYTYVGTSSYISNGITYTTAVTSYSLSKIPQGYYTVQVTTTNTTTSTQNQYLTQQIQVTVLQSTTVTTGSSATTTITTRNVTSTLIYTSPYMVTTGGTTSVSTTYATVEAATTTTTTLMPVTVIMTTNTTSTTVTVTTTTSTGP